MSDVGAVAMVVFFPGSLQEGAWPATERSIAPPGGQPAEGQHRRLCPDRLAALLLPTGHQTGRWAQSVTTPSLTHYPHPYHTLIVIIPKSEHTRPMSALNGAQ